ncbi:hypothetical protein [Thiobacillus thioparus]|uniref:hypothetical protein n=1 Tax=Thiobacillus thioparus TaxID=931 RepID=UPI001B7FB26C|nr:hypothetical protein [Thiobacillus thioparus]
MLQTIPPSTDNLHLRVPAQAKLIIGVILAMWFSLVVVLGTGGAFAGPPGRPPLPILVAVVAPLALFFIASRLSPWFYGLVMAADLRILVSMQAWRAGGLGFLALYAHDVLPGFFAFPAGLGDIAVGVTAPLVLLALLRRPDFVASRGFRRWNWLGILDLVMALTLGAFGSMLARGVPGEITTGVMAFMPEVIIPAYLVPIFLMLHMVSLMQSRRMQASA